MAEDAGVNDGFNRALAAARRELEDIGLDIVEAATRYLDKHGVNVDGDLRNSITSEVKRELGLMTLEAGTNVRYAIFVHEGTRPHWPPKAPIRRWVRKKSNLKGKPKEINRATFFVRRKISQQGTKARPFLAVALRLYRNIIAKRIGDAIRAELR